MSTLLTGYKANVMQANDTYLLNMIDPETRPASAVINITRNASYDGSISVQGRARGSSAAYQPIPYTNQVTGTLNNVTALTTGNHSIKVDTGGLEVVLVTTGRTQGTATVDVAPTFEV